MLIDKNKLPDYFLQFKKSLDPFYIQTAKAGISQLDACLSYVLSLSQIDNIILGVNNEKQLKKILNSCLNKYKFDASKLYCDNEALINPMMWE